jgi:hypothetical protein
MPVALSSDQWENARALAEGAAPTHERLAAAMGIYQCNLSRRAAREGWTSLDFRRREVRDAHFALMKLASREPGDGEDDADAPNDLVPTVSSEVQTAMTARAGETRQQRIARMGEMILSQTDKMLTRAELAGRPPDRNQVAALLAMTQLAERLSVETQMTALAQQEKDDDELARLYQWMDDNIVRLAYGICHQYLEVEGVGADVIKQFDIISEGFKRIMDGAEGHRKTFTNAVHAWERTHAAEAFEAVIANMPPPTSREQPEPKRLA